MEETLQQRASGSTSRPDDADAPQGQPTTPSSQGQQFDELVSILFCAQHRTWKNVLPLLRDWLPSVNGPSALGITTPPETPEEQKNEPEFPQDATCEGTDLSSNMERGHVSASPPLCEDKQDDRRNEENVPEKEDDHRGEASELRNSSTAAHAALDTPTHKPKGRQEKGHGNRPGPTSRPSSQEKPNVYKRIISEVREPVTGEDYKKDATGDVYVFILKNSDQRLVKIGFTTTTFEHRKGGIQESDKVMLEIVPDPEKRRISTYRKLERLVHMELHEAQKIFRDRNGSSHREYFDIDPADALETVQFWRRFLLQNPYNEGGELKACFRERIVRLEEYLKIRLDVFRNHHDRRQHLQQYLFDPTLIRLKEKAARFLLPRILLLARLWFLPAHMGIDIFFLSTSCKILLSSGKQNEAQYLGCGGQFLFLPVLH
ncbi:hypothetical protein BDY21DRAFT_365718 [Lineolata rhizophorae]|uniref:Bacteriophage T5 Orf172 DNA-binding domain-containing protein n=1 Tax=Lineolata rhizophorae TaxID=578093 RepID=A0A6A6NTN2_9PEZI|nr:hypothetical protein BDY21DRAFT_365718 [Lineolata rhizophorae]